MLSALVATTLCVAVPLLADGVHTRAPVLPPIHPTIFATAPAGVSRPDDIAKLGHLLYVTYQNNTGAARSPAGRTSSIVAFDQLTGAARNTWVLHGRCEPLTADPEHHRLLATVNEDLISSLFVFLDRHTPGRPRRVLRVATGAKFG